MSGLDSEQLDELVWRSKISLKSRGTKDWAPEGPLSARSRHRGMRLYAAEHNPGSLGEIFDTSQPVISGIITKFTPLIEASTKEDRPTVDEAKGSAAREQTVLVDGFLAPTWSWRDTPELWSGKHKTTGFNGQAIANLRGDLPSCPSLLPGIITT